jgi:predicted nucleic acid-binding protein
MTSILGNKTVVLDSDALIGLIHENDALHPKCLAIAEYLQHNSFATIVPYPIILEAATALAKDKTIRRADLSAQLLQDFASIETNPVEDFNQISKMVTDLYHPRTSTKNTPFDFYVLATAKFHQVEYIFSFDEFYKKRGLKLTKDLLD